MSMTNGTFLTQVRASTNPITFIDTTLAEADFYDLLELLSNHSNDGIRLAEEKIFGKHLQDQSTDYAPWVGRFDCLPEEQKLQAAKDLIGAAFVEPYVRYHALWSILSCFPWPAHLKEQATNMCSFVEWSDGYLSEYKLVNEMIISLFKLIEQTRAA